MPVWGIAASVVVLVVLGGIALVASSQQVQADYTAQPRPNVTFIPKGTVEAPAPPTVLFIGDSYSAGAGASAPELRWTTLASAEHGWSEQNRALGGTGYVKTAGPEGCGLDYCGTYREVIDGVTDTSPDIVIVSGGRNDGQPAATYAQTVADTIAAVRAKWPETQIVVTSPIWDDDAPPRWFGDVIAATQSAAASSGATWLDLGQPLAGDAALVVEDSIHPSDAGYAAIAAAFTQAWNVAGLG